MATRKQKEIEQLLRREISRIILYELSDPRMGFVALTRVQLTGDYRSAKVLLSFRGKDVDRRKTLAALEHARGHIQTLIGERLTLRWTPVLEFAEDVELNEALRLERLIDQVRREDREARSDLEPDIDEHADESTNAGEPEHP